MIMLTRERINTEIIRVQGTGVRTTYDWYKCRINK